MKALVLAAVAWCVSNPVEVKRYYGDIGPIATSTCIHRTGKQFTLTAYARNDSGRRIRRATWCIRAKNQRTGCLYNLWNTEPWEPGEKIQWEEPFPFKGDGLPDHVALLTYVSLANELDSIQTVYVEPIAGQSGEMARTQLMAVITNSGRFQVTENPQQAQAILRGRSDTRDTGEVFDSSSRSLATATSQITQAILGIHNQGIEASRSAANSKTKTIITETLVLRLVLPSGKTVWAWDNTKPCAGTKAKCAIADLVGEATK
ncbi:MAG: hypothetical protein M1541_04845 [Acidobacteria bacterium]|nr:hypothetical protein [Acidobacteriota bacterium]